MPGGAERRRGLELADKNPSGISATHDATLAVFTQMNWQEQVFIASLSPDGKSLLSHRRLTLDENVNAPFAWTPDSKSVLFSSNRNGGPQIFRQAIDQPESDALISKQELSNIPRVSPDGGEVLFLSVPQSDSASRLPSIQAVSLSGGAPRLVLQNGGISNLQCAAKPSTRCIYSAVHDQEFVFYSFDYRTGRETRLRTVQASSRPQWSLSRNGSTLAMISGRDRGARIQLFSLNEHTVRELAIHGWIGLLCVDWAADGNSLFVTTVDPEGGTAFYTSWLDGHFSVLLNKTHGRVDWGVPSPDGHLLAIAENSGTGNILAVQLPSTR